MSVQNYKSSCFQKLNQFPVEYLLNFLWEPNNGCSSGDMLGIDRVAREMLAHADRCSPKRPFGVGNLIAVIRRFSNMDNPQLSLGSCLLLIRTIDRIGKNLPIQFQGLKEHLFTKADPFLQEEDVSIGVHPFLQRMRSYPEKNLTKMELIVKCLEEILVRIEIDYNFTFKEELLEVLNALMDLNLSLSPAGVDLVRWALKCKCIEDLSPFRKLLGAS